MSNQKSDWMVLSQKLHNELNEIKRDALLPYVISILDGIDNPQDLYAKLLIDVEMGSQGTTSPIKEAIAAVQLYFHRYFVNLERLVIQGEQTPQRRVAIKKELQNWWKWMKNYRVWEANRKVFLYPENYIRPELRSAKTAAFQTLEEDLLQGEITDDLVGKAYKKYLDEYTEVSRLEIAGGYVYGRVGIDSGNRHLVLFGRTKTDPRRYYYRLAEFMTDSVLWEPWLRVNVQIDADKVYPVFAFERVFVFWTQVETQLEDASSTAVTSITDGNKQTVTSDAQANYCIKIFYSFYNLNKEWVSPQLLTEEIRSNNQIKDVRLFVENSEKLIIQGAVAEAEHENIVISCTYQVGRRVRTRAFSLTPELYTQPAKKPGFDGNGKVLFRAIFDEPEIDDKHIVLLNSSEKTSDGPWFSFDYKGGSFLCKPDTGSLSEDIWPKNFTTDLGQDLNVDNWSSITQPSDNNTQAWQQIDAAVQIPAGTSYLFNGEEYIAVRNNQASAKSAIAQTWGKVRDRISQTGIVDAALFDERRNQTYLFNENEYLRFSNEQELADVGYPKLLANNPDGLPNWDRIDAAFSWGGKNYFFHNQRQIYVVSDALNVEKPTREFWGNQGTTIDIFNFSFNAPLIDAAFVLGDDTYLLNQSYFIKYKHANYEFVEIGYPREHNLYAVLEAMGCENNSDAYRQQRITSAFDMGGNVYLTALQTDERGFTSYIFRQRRIIESSISDRWFAGFAIGNVTYNFRGPQLFVSDRDVPQGLASSINAAFVGKDDRIYLFSREEYLSFPVAETIDANINNIVNAINQWESNKQNIRNKWGRISNNIEQTGIVDAGFAEGNKIYLFSGNQYFVYSQASDSQVSGEMDEGYPQVLENNPHNLPEWDRVDAVLNTRGRVTRYFFNNQSQTFVESGNFNQPQPTAQRWGRLQDNNFIANGKVDAAYATDQHLFLTSGNQFVRYTLSPQSEPGEFVDIGYPKLLNRREINHIDAAFRLDGQLYLFADDEYSRLENDKELDSLNEFQFIQGNWGNIPYQLREGIDAAFDWGNNLYIFKDSQYIRYALDAVKPYEIGDAGYEIIRLTTSTAYKLNQTLFAGGIPSLLSLNTQEIDDIPAFTLVDSRNTRLPQTQVATTIKVLAGKVRDNKLPISDNLDFNSANGIYYWEVFFHAPFLIAQSLNAGQKFAEAKTWYEYIFNPSNESNHWQFLPFQPLGEDIQSIINRAKEQLPQQPPEEGTVLATINTIVTWLEPIAGDLQRDLEISAADEQYLDTLADLTQIRDRLNILNINIDKIPLIELTELVEKLSYRYNIRQNKAVQIASYLKDPFDPHAIAAFRHIAYQKAVVMAYIDNLLDWGDMLFRQYTQESINEARMLYILAYDLLGQRPENIGQIILESDRNYNQLAARDDRELDREQPNHLPLKALKDGDDDYDFLVYPQGTPNDSVLNPYFFIPNNTLFTDYWHRVADRLYKIRNSLNILGISQPLPLFQPPIDPMALVQAAGSGTGISAALAGTNIPIPHYRFTFMVSKAQNLTIRLSQFGGELLNTLEKKDAEELSIMQNRQEEAILPMTRNIKIDQLEEANASIASLEESLKDTQNRVKHYDKLISQGLSPTEIAQVSLMASASVAHMVSSGLKIVASFGSAAPDALVGPFIAGVKYGGSNAGDSLRSVAEVSESIGEGLSVTGEVLGIVANHQRMLEDWELQKSTAQSEVTQINAQLVGARLQAQIAQREIDILDKEIEHHESIKTFMKEKFTNSQLYQWMASKLAGMYYQTYQMAYDMAKAAEKAFQFERGIPESQVNYINGLYWDSQRKGLLAGESLGLDLDRMEKAYFDTHNRGFEISKNISLIELDPVALLQLKSQGSCEFSLSEALFDYDFPGHYRRQIKTISLSFDAAEGETVIATLTQLNHKTILEPDTKAVKYLLDPKGQTPLTIRYNWHANQQIALSYVDQYEKNNGLFELRFDSDRYLPFEGTGAVSTWRLELKGKKGSYNINELLDITINLKYTAEAGGTTFANAVKTSLKPYQTVRFFDMHYDFPEIWNEFLDSDSKDLILPFSPDLFPNMGSSKISGIFSKYDLYQPGAMSMTLNYQDDLKLDDGKYLATNGLSISNQGTDWILTVKGDKTNLRNINLVVGYQATV